MYRFLSWYNQNRRKIWVTIIAVVIIWLIAFRVFNMINGSMKNSESRNTEVDLSLLNSVTTTTQRSAVSGNEVPDLKESLTIIDDFVSCCNSGKIEEAYNLLSDECKEKMYENIDKFKNNYYNQIFGKGKRNATVTNWVGDIYKVNFAEDALSTGKSSAENKLQDYITIVLDSQNNRKLNINGYIRTVELNKTAKYEKISVKAIKKDVYFDYEIYTIEIENNSESNVRLGDISETEFSYLTDKKDFKYNANINLLAEADVKCVSNFTKTVQIMYLNQYSSDREIKSLTFPYFAIEYTGEDSITVHKEMKFDF